MKFSIIGIFTLLLFSYSIDGQVSNCSNVNSETCFLHGIFNTQYNLSISKGVLLTRDFNSMSTPIVTINPQDCTSEINLSENRDNKSFIVTLDRNFNKIREMQVTDFFSFNAVNYSIINRPESTEPYIIMALNQFDNYKNRLLCKSYQRDTIWISDLPYSENNNETSNLSISDINHDGIEEVIVFNRIFNTENGILLADGGNFGKGGKNSSIVVGEFNGDDRSLELAAGNTVYEVEINNLEGIAGNFITPHVVDGHIFIKDGLTSMADVNHDGISDIIVMPEYVGPARPFLYAYTFVGSVVELIGFIKLPLIQEPSTDRKTGRPVYGKVGPEGRDGILVTTTDSLRFITYDGTSDLKQQWAYYLEDRHGGLSPTLFDFNGDGENEIIYKGVNDLVILNVIDNEPVEIYRTECKSSTYAENPIVADIDNDGEAEICTICEDENGRGRLTIFSSPEDGLPWAPARGIWNQYGYHVLNINDDMTVPQYMENNATYMGGKYNNFMVQESLLGEDGMVQYPAASLYGEMDCVYYDELTGQGSIDFYIYNNEDASRSASDSVIVSFYNGDPYNGGVLLDTMEIRGGVPPGGVKTGTFTITDVTGIDMIYLLVNAMSVSTGSPRAEDFIQRECDVTDNVYMIEVGYEMVDESISLCGDDDYDFYGEVISTAGIYFHREEDAMGCLETLYELEVEVVDVIRTALAEAACGQYAIGDDVITESGIYEYSYPSTNGCDSIVTLDLTINNAAVISQTQSSCDSYDWNGNTYTESGTYEFATETISGCDSAVTLSLTIYDTYNEVLTVQACESYDWNGTAYTTSGIYDYDGVNHYGCDSLVTLELTISDEIEVSMAESACESYTWNGNVYTYSGSYEYSTTSINGCDSTITLDLTINNAAVVIQTQSSCDSYDWNGNTYTESGTYEYATQTLQGCDSMVILSLTIYDVYDEKLRVQSCESYDWNGETYTTSGIYNYEGITQYGCDSLVTLDLSINEEIEETISHQACESYTWNGIVYTSSGLYDYRTTSTAGCDSLVTLDLTIQNGSTISEEAISCDSYDWNGETYTESGTYEYQTLSENGCDSMVMLTLSILAESQIEEVSTCEGYTWEVNGARYEKSGLYEAVFVNQYGCDSIEKLSLNISESYNVVNEEVVCGPYLWELTQDVYNESGTYIKHYETASGCDSVYTLSLIINESFLSQDTVKSIEPYKWEINNTTYEESGVYQEVLESAEGCDSIYMLLLTIDVDNKIDYPNVLQGGKGRFNLYGSIQLEMIEVLNIYDRWGNQLVHIKEITPNDPSDGWDGTREGEPVTPGVYIWQADIRMKNGSKIQKAGDVTIVE